MPRALRLGHFLEADALAHVEVLVHPLAPLGVVDGKGRLRALRAGERGEPRLGGQPHRLGGDARGADGKQARDGRAVVVMPLKARPARGLGVGRHLETARRAWAAARLARGQPEVRRTTATITAEVQSMRVRGDVMAGPFAAMRTNATSSGCDVPARP